MGRPKTSWVKVHLVMRALSGGANQSEAATAAGLSLRMVSRLVSEHGVMPVHERRHRPNALRIEEREEIMLGISSGESDSEIGRRLGRHRGTVGREIAANGGRHRYRAYRAQARADACARRPRERWWVKRPELFDTVTGLLVERKWSPEQVAAILRQEHPDEPEWWVSSESIYQRFTCRPRVSSANGWRWLCVPAGAVANPTPGWSARGDGPTSPTWSTSARDPQKLKIGRSPAIGKGI